MGSMRQAMPRFFFLTLTKFIVALIYSRHGFEGLGMVMVFFNRLRYVRVLIYPRHGFEGPGKAMVQFKP